jgi:hypothetical protein
MVKNRYAGYTRWKDASRAVNMFTLGLDCRLIGKAFPNSALPSGIPDKNLFRTKKVQRSAARYAI